MRLSEEIMSMNDHPKPNVNVYRIVRNLGRREERERSE